MPEDMIASIPTGKGTITFSNKGLPPGGLMQNNPLHLTVACLQNWILPTVANNRSTVNCGIR